MNIIEKYNQLEGKKLYRGEIRKLINEAKKQGETEIENKLTGLLRSYPDQKGFEFEKVDPIQENFEALGIPYISESEINLLGSNEAQGLGKGITNNDIYNMVTNRLISQIEKTGNLPWSSGRKKAENVTGQFAPKNFSNQKYYRGINGLMLLYYPIGKNPGGEIIVEEIEDGRLFWLTFKQIKELKGKLRKGAIANQAIYYNFVYTYNDKRITEQKYKELYNKFNCSTNTDSDNCKKLFKNAFLKYYSVFNERDIEDIDFDSKRKNVKQPSIKTEEKKILAGDLIIKNMPKKPKLSIRPMLGNSHPNFDCTNDIVNMPSKPQFEELENWYGVLFHEHVHSTGHKSRLYRKSLACYRNGKDTERALEELVAEIGSMFLNAESGIMLPNLKNNASYIKGWATAVKKELKKDNKAIFIASGQAQKACDYILDRDENGDPKFWKEYENIQKEIKVKGAEQVKGKSSKVKAESSKVETKPVSKSKDKIADYLKHNKIEGTTLAQAKAIYEDFEKSNKYGRGLHSEFLRQDVGGKHAETLGIKGFNESTSSFLQKAYDDGMTLKYSNEGRYFLTHFFGKTPKKPTKKTKPVAKPVAEPKVKAETRQLALFGLNGVINIDSHKFNDFSKSELRKFLLEYYNKNLKGKNIAIENSIKKVELLNRAGRKISKGSAVYSAKTAVMEHLEDVIKQSTYNNWGSPKKTDSKDLLGFMNFKSKVIINGEKRHVRVVVEVWKSGRTLLKSYDVGMKKPHLSKDSPKLSSSPNEVKKNKPSKSKDTKKSNTGLKGVATQIVAQNEKPVIQNVSQRNTNKIEPIAPPVAEPIEKPIARTKNPLVRGVNHVSAPNKKFIIGGDIGNFLGDIEIKPVGSVACTVDAEQGAGKTRFLFQVANEMAKNYRVLFVSLEEHPDSSLFKDKVEQYISTENQNNIDAIGELERGKEKQILNELVPQYDIIIVDSWNKIYEAAKLDFDTDLRKAYNGKLIFAIFQRTTKGSMRGGTKAAFDGDIIMKGIKGSDFKENLIMHNKNRYQSKDLDSLKYNIYHQQLVKTDIIDEPIAIIPNGEQTASWDDATIEI